MNSHRDVIPKPAPKVIPKPPPKVIPSGREGSGSESVQDAHDRAVAEVRFERTGYSTFHGTIEGIEKGTYTMALMFDASDYPLERHCRYMRHPGGSTPHTFPNMVFGDTPPGRRVGPWPCWRGIPDMPEVTVEAAGRSVPVRFQFWGDELTCRRVRGVANIQIDGDLECTLVSADERLVPLKATVYSSTRPAVEPVPVGLRNELAGTFPRLLVTEGEIGGLHERSHTTHRHIWSRMEDLLGAWHLPPAKTPESKAVEGPERLFADDRAVMAAFRALVSPTTDHVDFARQAYLDYIIETERDDFEPLHIDTQSGEALFCLCTCYDWLHAYLTPGERERAERRLWEVADICWNHLGYDRHDFAQAHFLGCGLGLLSFSFLFWETHPRAHEWAAYLRGTFERVLKMLPEDGFYPHGINLWIYEYSFLLRWLELFRVCAGENYWNTTAHWKRASLFRACATSPDGLYGITMGDPQYRVGGDSWCHYLIAARTGSGEAQWLGQILADGPYAGVDYRHIPPRRRVYEVLYYDASIDASPIHSAVHHFQDGGQVFARSARVETGTLFTFRSGPPIGQKRRRAGEPGAYGHSDPANGSFMLFRRNAFLVCGPGPTYRRDTALHNTITFDGQGQIGDSTVWLPDFFPPEHVPPCTEVRTDGSTMLLFADLSPSYLPHLGVEVCTRSMLIDLKSAIVAIDTVRCATPKTIEWNVHSWGMVQALTHVSPGAFRLVQGADSVDFHILSPDGWSWRTGPTDVVPAYPHDGTRDTFLQLTVRQQETRWVWCLAMAEDVRPELVQETEGITIRGLPGGEIHFDGKWLMPEGFHETLA